MFVVAVDGAFVGANVQVPLATLVMLSMLLPVLQYCVVMSSMCLRSFGVLLCGVCELPNWGL